MDDPPVILRRGLDGRYRKCGCEGGGEKVRSEGLARVDPNDQRVAWHGTYALSAGESIYTIVP